MYKTGRNRLQFALIHSLTTRKLERARPRIADAVRVMDLDMWELVVNAVDSVAFAHRLSGVCRDTRAAARRWLLKLPVVVVSGGYMEDVEKEPTKTSDEEKISEQVWWLDLVNMTWVQMESLPRGRAEHATVLLRVPDGPPRLVHVGGCEYHNHLEKILGHGAALVHQRAKIMVLQDGFNIIEGGSELCRMDCAVIKGPAVLASDGEDCTITLYGGGGGRHRRSSTLPTLFCVRSNPLTS